jgi:hypothetical protein
MATIAQPQQPDLRAFIVYDHVPVGCTPHLITNNDTAPLLHPGDVVLIDTADRQPAPELFLIRWATGALNLVQLYSRELDLLEPDRSTKRAKVWFCAAFNRPRTQAAWKACFDKGYAVGMSDGPYRAEGPGSEYLPSKLVGRVVGILQAANAEPLRQIGRAA